MAAVGFVWDSGDLTVLDPFPDGYMSFVNWMSANGEYKVGTGWIEALPIYRAFQLKSGQIVDLGSLPAS